MEPDLILSQYKMIARCNSTYLKSLSIPNSGCRLLQRQLTLDRTQLAEGTLLIHCIMLVNSPLQSDNTTERRQRRSKGVSNSTSNRKESIRYYDRAFTSINITQFPILRQLGRHSILFLLGHTKDCVAHIANV